MSARNDGGPAFPVTLPEGTTWMDGETRDGMTLRDYFAAKALPAIVAAYVEANGRCIGTEHVHSNCATHAYRMADAMLTAREVA